VLDFGRPEDAERAARSALEPGLDVSVLIVENGTGGSGAIHRATPGAAEVPRLSLPDNLGFAGGMNAGVQQHLAGGCDRILLLNNDAVLEPGCLSLLVEALEDPGLGAVGPVILRAEDGRVESRGLRVDLRRGRVRLEGAGAVVDDGGAATSVDGLSGAVLMTTAEALARVGLLDPDYFFSFEDVDWCVRARRAGFELRVVAAARARHAGSRTIGRSPERLYFAARNHLRCAEKLEPLDGLARAWRRVTILARNLAFALAQRDVGRARACRAVIAGFRDARAGRLGRRPV
jgi:GT2 family glycosyltransferase